MIFSIKCHSFHAFFFIEKILLAVFTALLAIFNFYWRKNKFIGDFHLLIGENQILLANWKFRTFFSSSCASDKIKS